MGTLQNYRSSKDYREILRVLQKASTHQDNILWQTTAAGRMVVPIHHFEIDFVSREVVIYYNGNLNKLDLNSTLYVKLDYRTSVFKVLDFKQGLNCIHLNFPDEIKTIEMRSHPRHHFLPNEDKFISLKPSLSGYRDTGNELQVRAMDISQQGLSIIISEQNRSYIKNNRLLWLTKLGDEKLDHPLLAEVIYMNNDVEAKYQTRKQKELKVGLKFSLPVPKHIYQHFLL